MAMQSKKLTRPAQKSKFHIISHSYLQTTLLRREKCDDKYQDQNTNRRSDKKDIVSINIKNQFHNVSPFQFYLVTLSTQYIEPFVLP